MLELRRRNQSSMDPLTHSVTGLLLGRAGLNRWLPQSPWVLLLAANAPDVDVVTAAGGSLSYLDYHRHLTHSLIALPLLAFLPVVLVRAFTHKPYAWKRAYGVSLAGVASHLALDYTNVYGVRFALPFSSRWFRLDSTSVVDFWIWAALFIALAAPLLARLVNLEIGASAHAKSGGRGFAVFALSFLLFYNCARMVLHERAVATLESRIYGGGPLLRVAAVPGPANPFRWRGLVETPALYKVYDLNLLDEFDPARGNTYYKPAPGPAMAAAGRTRVFRDFLRFAQYPIWRVLPVSAPENGTAVQAMDLRFGTPAQPGFVATAILDGRLDVVQARFDFEGVRLK